MTFAVLCFWGSIVLLAYIYAGYPVFVWVLATTWRTGSSTVPKQGNQLPSISIVIAAYNEADCIEATVRNKLELDYPRHLLDVIVVSDGSEDETNQILAALADEHPGRLRFIRQPARGGKTLALNTAVAASDAEVIVFSDANSIYEPTALRHLVEPFADPEVGYVTGQMVYVNEDGTMVGDGCTAYMRYENFIRAQESEIGSVVGVDGGIDAVRRTLFRPMEADRLPDFLLPLNVVRHGYRVAYAPSARLFEATLQNTSDEFRMRVRVALRALRVLLYSGDLLNPLRYPLFSIQLWSHKVLRYFTFVPQLTLLACSIYLWRSGWFYSLALAGQIAFYGLAWGAYAWPGLHRLGRLFSLPLYFNLTSLSSAIAAFRLLRGEQMVVWQPRKG